LSSLQSLFKPNSIAVIGASNNKEKIGYSIVENIKNCGYSGAVYPINPKRRRFSAINAILPSGDRPPRGRSGDLHPRRPLPPGGPGVRPGRGQVPGGDYRRLQGDRRGGLKAGKRAAGDLPGIQHAAGGAQRGGDHGYPQSLKRLLCRRVSRKRRDRLHLQSGAMLLAILDWSRSRASVFPALSPWATKPT